VRVRAEARLSSDLGYRWGLRAAVSRICILLYIPGQGEPQAARGQESVAHALRPSHSRLVLAVSMWIVVHLACYWFILCTDFNY